MNVNAVLAQLQAQRSALDAAIAALQKLNPGAPIAGRKRRTLSPEARAKISAAAKARWAKVKKTKATAA